LKIPKFEELVILVANLTIDIKNQEEIIASLRDENSRLEQRLEEITGKYAELLAENSEEDNDGRGIAESKD
jgi:SMC interacting uncharacterized protein involved in chromosome segregation